MIVRLEPVAGVGSLPIEDVTVGGVVLTLAGSDGLGADGVQEATKKSVNAKETARRPNFLWRPRMSLRLPHLDDVQSVLASPFGPQ